MSEHRDDTHQFLTFTLAEEMFALNIARVREVLELTRITRIPRTPECMLGVINLRGHAVPVVDMRAKFSMPGVEHTVDTCIIIAEVGAEVGADPAGQGASALVGALVDSVREVSEMPPESIDAPPRMGAAIAADFLSGMGRRGEAFVMVLDIERVFSVDELAELQQAAGAAAEEQEARAA